MRPWVRSRLGSRMACCKWPMIGLCQSMNQMAPSGPILMSDGRKFGSVEERIGSTSVAAKQEALEADHVGHQQVALVFLREVAARQDFDAGTGARALLIHLRRFRVLLRE